MSSLYEFTLESIDGDDLPLKNYKGEVLLVVNVATKCGYNVQYAGFEELYQKYEDKGFAVIGVPCNQFMNLEPDNEETIKQFCSNTWGTTFPMTRKLKVNGSEEAPLYRWLKDSKPGIFGLKRVKWNFEKFLIDRNGNVVRRFAFYTKPYTIDKYIEKLVEDNCETEAVA